MRATVLPRLQTPYAAARSYSAQANGAPEPPDFLNEAELHVFNKIKGELEPTKLEVRAGSLMVLVNGVREIVETHVIYSKCMRLTCAPIIETRDRQDESGTPRNPRPHR